MLWLVIFAQTKSPWDLRFTIYPIILQVVILAIKIAFVDKMRFPKINLYFAKRSVWVPRHCWGFLFLIFFFFIIFIYSSLSLPSWLDLDWPFLSVSCSFRQMLANYCVLFLLLGFGRGSWSVPIVPWSMAHVFWYCIDLSLASHSIKPRVSFEKEKWSAVHVVPTIRQGYALNFFTCRWDMHVHIHM